ncbi:MAG: HNH endonuclease [Phycisphaerales bacterium]
MVAAAFRIAGAMRSPPNLTGWDNVAISARDLRLLFQQSGNQCAFPGCVQRLTFDATNLDRAGSVSEVAHIVGQSPDGPRGDHPMPSEERDRFENLILLCDTHHTQVDRQTATYTVESLRQMKFDHESLIAEATRRAVQIRAYAHTSVVPHVSDRLFSSLLPVERLPKYLFSMECFEKEPDIKQRLLPPRAGEASSFVVRGQRLYCFHDLRRDPGPFADLARGQAIEREEALDVWTDNDRRRWYVDLLNRTLNKITGRRGLNLDRRHHRYFFDMVVPDQERVVEYRPMNVSRSEMSVVWRPITKKTGLPKKYWYHRAIALSFVQTSSRTWCLALRPELRVTKDGKEPIEPRTIGGKVTKKKSRMFNLGVLNELNFWRDYLFEGRPRLVIQFGKKGVLAVSANFLACDISWPGVPPDRAKEFKNAIVEEQLFDMPALEVVTASDEDDGDDFEFEEE